MPPQGDILAQLKGPAAVHAHFIGHVVVVPAFDRPCYVDIEGTSVTRTAKGAAQFSARDPGEGEQLVRLLDRRVLETLTIKRDGTLLLEFDSDLSVTVVPDPMYESWSVMYDGRPWIGLPRGGVG